jgi:hypothetical protein
MNENITRILKMVEDGKISADKAAELIEAIKVKEADANQKSEACCKEKMFKVNVLSGKGDKVNIKLPVKFVKSSLKAFGKMPVNVKGCEGIDMKIITDAIENDIEGEIIKVKCCDGDDVEIKIE